MKNVDILTSNRKGQAIVSYFSNNENKKVTLIFHANSLIPLVDTVHFGIKPGHFMLHDDENGWIVKDGGYINYFRPENKNINQTEYNTISKQKITSKGFLFTKRKRDDGLIELKSFSLFPLHYRKITLNVNNDSISIKDVFFGKGHIQFNFKTKFVSVERWFYSNYFFNF